MDKKVDIIKDADGKSIVAIIDLRFKGRRSVDWNVVEDSLKEYIGECTEITETSDREENNEETHCNIRFKWCGKEYCCKSIFG